MFSYISEGEPKEYGFLPAGVYEGKIVKMEEGISQGAKTRGCPQLIVHIKAFGPEGAATVRYFLTAKQEMNWKIDSFIKNVTGQVFDSGKQVIINESDFIGKPCYVRIIEQQGDRPKADGTYPVFSNCSDVLDPDEARAIMAEQARVEAARRDRQAAAKQYFPEFAGRTDGGDRWIGLIPFEVTTTNVAHARYLMDDKGTVEYLDNGDGPVDPGNPGDAGDYNSAALYAKFAESIYKATRVMPYDGSATVHDDFDQVCGGRLSITGGCPQWETMRSVIQEITLDLKTGASDVTVGAAEQLSLQDSIDKSKQLAAALRDTSQASASTSSGDGSAGGIVPDGGGGSPGPVQDDKKPELPSVGPSVKIGQAQEPPAMGTSAVEVGYQCRLAYDDAGKVNEAYIRQGKAMYAGNYIGGMLPEGAGSGGWVKSPTTSGEVWLKVQLDKDTKYLGSYLSAVGGVSDPVTLATEKRETPYDYYFHLATIDGNKVVQHQTGTIYLQIHPGTFGPSGKS